MSSFVNESHLFIKNDIIKSNLKRFYCLSTNAVSLWRSASLRTYKKQFSVS